MNRRRPGHLQDTSDGAFQRAAVQHCDRHAFKDVGRATACDGRTAQYARKIGAGVRLFGPGFYDVQDWPSAAVLARADQLEVNALDALVALDYPPEFILVYLQGRPIQSGKISPAQFGYRVSG